MKNSIRATRPIFEAVEPRVLFSTVSPANISALLERGAIHPVQLAAPTAAGNSLPANAFESQTVLPAIKRPHAAVRKPRAGAKKPRVSASVGGTGLTGEYFSGNNFQQAVMLRTDPTVAFSWPTGAPDSVIPNGGFSARWTGQIAALYSENYTFYARSDDGVRLWVNGQLIIDDWNAQALKETTGSIQLQAGQKYSIRLDYFKNGNGPANAQLSWSSASQKKQVVPASVLFADPTVTLPAGPGLTGQYFKGNNFQQLVLTRTDSQVNMNWLDGTPDSAVPSGPFSIRYTGQIRAAFSEKYTISAIADDGVRLWVNGNLLIDDWHNHLPKVDKATFDFVSGQKYDIRIEYYENGAPPASLQLLWQSASTPRQVIPISAFSTTPSATAGTLRVAGVGVGQIDLSWDGSANATGYSVQRAPAGSTAFAQVGTTAAGLTTFSDTGLPPTTSYVYRIVPLGSADVVTPSNAVTGTDLPASPQNAEAAALSPTSIGVSWGTVYSATEYAVARSLDGTNFSIVGTVAATDVSFTDTGLLAGTAYTYRIVATNSAGSSPSSNNAAATTPVPSAPATLTATAVSTSQINLAWNGSAGAAAYEVDRSANGSTGWTAIGTVNGSTTTYPDTGLTAGTTYYYRVIADSPSGQSAATPAAHDTTVPTSPTGITASATSSTTAVIGWSDVSGEAGFIVLASADNGAHYAQIGTTGAGVLTLNAHGLIPGTTYLFEVKATNRAGTSAPSTPATATTMSGAPPGVTATTVSSTEIDLAWNATAGATGYEVLRGTDNLNFADLHAIVGGGTTSYADTSALPGAQYFYVVMATNAGGRSLPSTSVNATTVPIGPLGLGATTISNQEIDLGWNPSPGSTGYVIQISTDGTTFNDLPTPVGSGTLMYAVTGLSSATLYTFRIIATDSGGRGLPGPAAAASTDPDAPLGVSATANSATQITVGWHVVAGATGYDVERSPDGATGWASAGTTTGINSTTLADTHVSAGTKYFYRVLATGAGGNSMPSSTVNATTFTVPAILSGQSFSSTEIDLTWNDVTGETGFAILESLNGGMSFSQISTTGQGTLFYQATGLAASTTHIYEVEATDAAGPSAPSNAFTATTRTAVPASLAATAVSASQINLSWHDVTGETGFVLDRSVDGLTGWTQTGGTIHGLSYHDTGLAAGTTYYYEVIAINGGGNSLPSTVASDTTAPATPTNLAATVSITAGHLTWDAMPGATSYIVLRSNGGSFSGVGTPASNSFDDIGLARGTTFSYEVIALNNAGLSAPTAPVSITTAPNSPSALSATAKSASEIDLSWNAAPTATIYTLEVSTDNITYTPMMPFGAGTLSYHDTNLSAATLYYFEVIASNAAGPSSPSASVNATTFTLAPTGLTISDDAANTPVSPGDNITQSPFNTNGPQIADLSWNDVTGETSFVDQISTDNGGSYQDQHTLSQGTTIDQIGGLSAGNIYYFDVISQNAGGPSAPSTRPSILFPPVPAYVINATADSSTQITVNWFGAYGATASNVWRSTTNGASGWSQIASVATGSFTDTTVSAGTAYYYKIVEVGDGGLASESGAVGATTPLPAPTGVTATGTSTTQITVSWSAVANASSYLVEASADGSTGWTTVGTTSSTSIADTGLSAGTSQYYRVTASTAEATSAPSSNALGVTFPAAPAGLAATVISDSEIDVSWNAAPTATSYTLESSTDNISYTPMAPLGAGTLSYNDTGLSAATLYYFEVIASNAAVPSSPSAPVNATTVTIAPTGLAVSNDATSTLVFQDDDVTQSAFPTWGPQTADLSWNDVTGETGFVDQKNGGTDANTLAQGTITDQITGLSAGNTYSFDVIAQDAGGRSAASTQQSLTFPPSPAYILGATADSSTQITVTWLGAYGATAHNVWRSTTNTLHGWSQVGSVAAGTFTDTTVAAGTTYYYKIVETGAGGLASESGEASATTPP